MAAKELVERVGAGDVDREPAGPATRPPPHLAQAGDRAGKVHASRRLKLADIDSQLEGVGRHDGEQIAAAESRLDLASLLRRVAAAVGSNSLRQLGPAPGAQVLTDKALDQLDSSPTFEE